MRTTLRAKFIASEIHALLFVLMWVFYSLFSLPIADGPSRALFVILLVADLPVSFPAFGVMFTSTRYGVVAATLWGILGTGWWFLIGTAIDARIHSYREKRAWAKHQGLMNGLPRIEPKFSPRKEFFFAASTAAVVVVTSLAWAWNGTQGHFDKGKIGDLVFAPDSRSILLVRSQGNSSRFERMDLTARKSTFLMETMPCTAYSPTFSPDGKQIAFACGSISEGRSRILLVDSEGGTLRPLFSTNIEHYDFAPHFNSDGTRVYFARATSPSDSANMSVAPTRQSWDIYSTTLDGKNEARVSDRKFEMFGVSYSRDGKKLVVSGDVSTGPQLRLYSIDEPDKAEIAIRPLIPRAPQVPIISDVVVSPDGQSIYFMAATDGAKGFDYDVYRADVTGGGVQKLTSANGYATALCISSDGRTAAFLRWTSRWGSLPNLSRLYTLDLESKTLSASKVTGME